MLRADAGSAGRSACWWSLTWDRDRDGDRPPPPTLCGPHAGVSLHHSHGGAAGGLGKWLLLSVKGG